MRRGFSSVKSMTLTAPSIVTTTSARPAAGTTLSAVTDEGARGVSDAAAVALRALTVSSAASTASC